MESILAKKNGSDSLAQTGLKPKDLKGFLDLGVSLEGKVRLEGPFRFDGRFKGEIECDGLLIVGEKSQIEGIVLAKELIVRGTVKGTLRVQEKIVILPGAHVSGEVHTDCLIIEAGARFEGNSHMKNSLSGTEGKKTEEDSGDGRMSVVPVQRTNTELRPG